MKTQPSFDDRLSEWLEDGPADAPDRVLETVLAAFPSIPQRRAALRVPWRNPFVNRSMRTLAGIAAAAVIAVGGLILLTRPPSTNIGGPPPSPSPSVAPTVGPSGSISPVATPLDTAAWTSFTSARHGVSLRYPSDWTVTPATAPWLPGTEGAPPPDPTLDVFSAPGTDAPMFVVLSQPLAAGVTGDVWLADYEAKGQAQFPPLCWPAPADMEQTTIGGQPAWIHGGLSSCGFTEAIVFAGNRVYELTGYGNAAVTAQFDRSLFDAFVSTVTFEPAKADDSPAGSPTPS